MAEPATPAPMQTHAPTQADKLIEFCLDSRHADSLLCSDTNPETPADPNTAVREIQIRQGSAGSSRPIVVESKETRTIHTQTTAPAKKPSASPNPTTPSPATQTHIRVPVPVKLPVKVPDVDVPVVNTKVSVEDNEQQSAAKEEEKEEPKKDIVSSLLDN